MGPMQVSSDGAPKSSRSKKSRSRGATVGQSIAVNGTASSSEPTRERIVNSAARLFAERGFENVSMPAIAKKAGITAGAIYKHFDSKAELLFEVVKRALQSIPLFVHDEDRGNDAAALVRLASAYTEPGLKLVRQLSIEVHSAASKDPKIARVLWRSDEIAMRRLGESIASAQQAGKLDSSLNPEFVARALSVFIMGLTHMDTLLPGLVGDREWGDFVRERIATLIGLRGSF